MNIDKATFFEINQDVVLYDKNNVSHNIHLRKGDILRLAGNKLSTMTMRSPFHYQDRIIRIPNILLKECKKDYINPVSITEKQVNSLYGVSEFSGVVVYPDQNEEEMRQKFRDKYDDKATLYTDIILSLFTVGIWALFFLWLWTLND